MGECCHVSCGAQVLEESLKHLKIDPQMIGTRVWRKD